MLKTITPAKPKVMRLGKLHACLLTRRSCQDLLGYCEVHGMGHKLDKNAS